MTVDLDELRDSGALKPFLMGLGGVAHHDLPHDETWHQMEIRVWARRKGTCVLLAATNVRVLDSVAPVGGPLRSEGEPLAAESARAFAMEGFASIGKPR